MAKIFLPLFFFFISCGVIKLAAEVPYQKYPGAREIKYVNKGDFIEVSFNLEAHCRSSEVLDFFDKILKRHGLILASDTGWLSEKNFYILRDKRYRVYKKDQKEVVIEVICDWMKVVGDPNAYISTEKQKVKIRYLGFGLDIKSFPGSICGNET